MKCINCCKPVEDSASYCEYCGAGVIYLPPDHSPDPSLKRAGPPGYMCFVLDKNLTDVSIFAEPNEESEILYKIGRGEPVLIVSEQEKWFEVLLPGEERGFVLKTAGRKLEISSEKITNPLGYYRLNPSVKTVEYASFGLYGSSGPSSKIETSLKEVKVYALPDNSSQEIVLIQTGQIVPIVEDKNDWFKVQLDDGVRGFVEKQYGIRTLRRESLPIPFSPDGKSISSVFGGVATFVGLMVLATVIGGINQGMKDSSS